MSCSDDASICALTELFDELIFRVHHKVGIERGETVSLHGGERLRKRNIYSWKKGRKRWLKTNLQKSILKSIAIKQRSHRRLSLPRGSRKLFGCAERLLFRRCCSKLDALDVTRPDLQVSPEDLQQPSICLNPDPASTAISLKKIMIINGSIAPMKIFVCRISFHHPLKSPNSNT